MSTSTKNFSESCIDNLPCPTCGGRLFVKCDIFNRYSKDAQRWLYMSQIGCLACEWQFYVWQYEKGRAIEVFNRILTAAKVDDVENVPQITKEEFRRRVWETHLALNQVELTDKLYEDLKNIFNRGVK